MEYDSSESMQSVERAEAPSPRTADVRVTAARRRRLQRRRAAAAQLAAAAAAVVVEPSTIDDEPGFLRVRRCRTIPPTDEWPAFEQLVVAPPIIRDSVTVECQTEAVNVRPVPPVTYHAGMQTEGTSTSDVAVGAQLSDRSWPEALSYERVVRLVMDNPLYRPEELLEMIVQGSTSLEACAMSAAQRHYVLGVIRGVAGGLAYLSSDLHEVLSDSQDNRDAFGLAMYRLWALTGEFMDRPM